jgi:membrane-associated phospholipid phosphatase
LPALVVPATAAIAVFLDISLGGPLLALDTWLARRSIDPSSPLFGPASLIDRIGLRGVTVPLLVVFGLGLRRSTGRWRPLGLATLAVLALNLTVGALKLGVGRGHPSSGDPDLFAGGVMWPSGHAANIAMTTALLMWLLRRYGRWPLSRAVAAAVVVVPTAMMTTVSVALGYHWLSDLVAGALIGLSVAALVRWWDGGHDARDRPTDRSESPPSGRSRLALIREHDRPATTAARSVDSRPAVDRGAGRGRTGGPRRLVGLGAQQGIRARRDDRPRSGR